MDIEKYKSQDRILVAVDCIIFGFDGQQLKALLIKRDFEPEQGRWSLMGGFVNRNESVDEAAIRVLEQLTGLKDIFMEQLFCFGDVDRDTAGRVVSVAYYALINIEDYNLTLGHEHEAQWFEMSALPDLIFDHDTMMQQALQRLRQKVATHPIGFNLLPPKFTLPQLQALYEAIFGYAMDKRNFSKKVLSLGILCKLNEKEKTSSKKGAFYYVFNESASFPRVEPTRFA